jgi:KipI family sensor histidine kinase inhibitor
MPLGDRALRIDVEGLQQVHRLAAAIRAASIAGVTDVVPAWRTVTVLLTESADLDAAREQIEALDPQPEDAVAPQSHMLPVRYDGADLDVVARHTGLSVEEVIARHAAASYTVAFLGFAPGFCYLSGLDPALATPRLADPRRSVGAGAVGIADDVTGVYPTDLPGGWNLLGHTTRPLFDITADPPALLAPGDRVRFERLGR